MIVCICNDINDKTIRQLIRKGSAGCIDSVRQQTGAGSCCGACEGKVESIIDQETLINHIQPATTQAP